MACFGNGSAVKLYYIQELADGSIPATAPNFKPLRFVSEGLTPNVNQIESQEMNPNRQRPPSRGGTYSVQGELQAELSFTSFDDLIAAAMQGEWTGNAVKIGSMERTFAIVERHSDIDVDYVYRGCRVNTMNISARLGDKAGITFGFIGTEAEPYTVPSDAVFAAATDTDIMVTTNGSFTEGDPGVQIAYATDWNMTLDNGMEAAFSLFQREAYCVTNGIATVGGSMTAYLKDATLWDKVLNEAQSKHVVVLEEGADTYTLTLPNLRYVSGTKQVDGPGAITPQYTYSAGYDATEGSTLTIARSGA